MVLEVLGEWYRNICEVGHKENEDVVLSEVQIEFCIVVSSLSHWMVSVVLHARFKRV